MDSYSFLTKEEIFSVKMPTARCNNAFISAIIHTNGSIIVSANKLSILLSFDSDEIKGAAFKALAKAYPFLTLTHGKEIRIEGERVTETLENLGILSKDFKVIPGIFEELVKSEEEMAAYVSGAFVGCGSVTIQNAGGYHLEFSLSNPELAYDLAHILAQFHIFTKLIVRKEKFVLYVKDAESISDTLALMRASRAVLTLNDYIVTREVKRNANRVINCDMANLNKTVSAGISQSEAIKKISARTGLDALPDKLKEMALIRLENPSATYEQLTEISGLAKSTVKYRLKKIIEAAERLE